MHTLLNFYFLPSACQTSRDVTWTAHSIGMYHKTTQLARHQYNSTDLPYNWYHLTLEDEQSYCLLRSFRCWCRQCSRQPPPTCSWRRGTKFCSLRLYSARGSGGYSKQPALLSCTLCTMELKLWQPHSISFFSTYELELTCKGDDQKCGKDGFFGNEGCFKNRKAKSSCPSGLASDDYCGEVSSFTW